MNLQATSFVLCAAGLLAATKSLRRLIHLNQGLLCDYNERLVAARDALYVAVSTSHLEFSSVLGAALEFTEAAMSLITLPDLSDIHVYIRKAEVLNGMHEFDCDAASTISSFQGAFMRLDFIRQEFYQKSAQAHLVSYDRIITQSTTVCSDFRIIQIGCLRNPTLRSDLDSSIQVIKEHDTVIVKEGPRDPPLAKWRFGTEPYSPMIELRTNVKRKWTIGRLSDCDILISDRTINFRHALVECSEGKWTITDQSSLNGTFQYLHTLDTLNGESDEFLTQTRGQVFLDHSSSFVVTLQMHSNV